MKGEYLTCYADLILRYTRQGRLGRWQLTAGTPRAADGVLRLSLLAVAVKRSLLAARARRLLRADAASLATTARCWYSGGSSRHIGVGGLGVCV